SRVKGGCVRRVVQIWIEVGGQVVCFIGMRQTVPTQSEVQGQAMGCAPVVLNVSAIGIIIPLAVDLCTVLTVSRSKTEQIICEVIAGKPAVKAEASLCGGEGILTLFVDSPTAAELDLMSALGPGNIITDLIIVRFIEPGIRVCGVVSSSAAGEIDTRDAIQVVGTGEQTVKGEARRSRNQALRNDMDAVAVVVECSFIQQRRADHIRGMNHSAIAGVIEHIADARLVITAPLGGSVSLGSLFRNPVTKHGELIVE